MISASIVLYKTPEDQLNRLVNCIAESTVRLRLYIVDNSPSARKELFADHPFITYIRSKENVGYGGGHNLAMRRILDQSEFHFVLNPDIYFGPDELRKMLDFIKQDETIGQLMPSVHYRDGSMQYLCKLIPTPMDLIVRRFAMSPLRRVLRSRIERFELRFTGYSRVMEVPLLSGCFMLFRVSALREVGLFDERFLLYLEDFDLCRRMNEKFKTVFFPGAAIVHDHARDSYRNRQSLRMHIESAIKYFNKWGWLHDPARSKVNQNALERLARS